MTADYRCCFSRTRPNKMWCEGTLLSHQNLMELVSSTLQRKHKLEPQLSVKWQHEQIKLHQFSILIWSNINLKHLNSDLWQQRIKVTVIIHSVYIMLPFNICTCHKIETVLSNKLYTVELVSFFSLFRSHVLQHPSQQSRIPLLHKKLQLKSSSHTSCSASL